MTRDLVNGADGLALPGNLTVEWACSSRRDWLTQFNSQSFRPVIDQGEIFPSGTIKFVKRLAPQFSGSAIGRWGICDFFRGFPKPFGCRFLENLNVSVGPSELEKSLIVWEFCV